MGNNLIITTPRGVLWQDSNQYGETVVRLEWAPDFAKRRTVGFNKAQAFVDSEVLRFCSARVPFQTGMLQKSGILGTVIGSGEVIYLAPYSRAQYKTKPTRSYDANRGGKWFERGKAAERTRILEGARRIAGGG